MKRAFPKAKVTGEFSIYGHEVRTGRGEGGEMVEGAEIRLISVLGKIRNSGKGLDCGFFISLPVISRKIYETAHFAN